VTITFVICCPIAQKAAAMILEDAR
jgi:hypothetical protein